MDKRQQLLSSAAELFTSRGIQNTSTAAISRHAGVATGTLFNYFASKNELIEQLYQYTRRSMIETTSVDTIDTTDYHHAFTILWRRGIDWGCDNPTLFWFSEEISRSAYRQMYEIEGGWFHVEPIMNFIQVGVDRGIVLDLPIVLIQTLILSTISGIVGEILINGADRKEYIEHSYEIVWRALTQEDIRTQYEYEHAGDAQER